MTKFQRNIVVLASIVVLVVCGVASLLVLDRAKPTREEQLAVACQRNPVDCEKMRIVRANTDAVIRRAERYGPAMTVSISELRRVQDEYDDRFIALGYYGDAPSEPLGNSVTVKLEPLE